MIPIIVFWFVVVPIITAMLVVANHYAYNVSVDAHMYMLREYTKNDTT